MAVLIFSSPNDQSTNNVIDWLIYFGTPFERTTFSQFCKNNTISIPIQKDGTLEMTNSNIVFRSVWFRRGEEKKHDANQSETLQGLLKQKHEEMLTISAIFNNLADEKIFWLSSINSTIINKLDVLIKAHKVGLKIPPSIITNHRSILLRFIETNDTTLCKSVSENFIFAGKINCSYKQPVIIVDIEKLKNTTETFFPSLFQKFIKKRYDIRVFYINGHFFSMAIINNSNDFRTSYSTNRNIPYRLPQEVCSKLDNLMQLLKLNTGSIDLIKGIDGDYYFLEINPNGQFGMVSQPCNYSLEKEIAQLLIKKDKENGQT